MKARTAAQQALDNAEREDQNLTPAERAKRRKAGESRCEAMRQTGSTTYRSLLAYLNDGGEKIERRP